MSSPQTDTHVRGNGVEETLRGAEGPARTEGAVIEGTGSGRQNQTLETSSSRPKPATTVVTVASYNIHACVGVDGKYDPGRIVAVLLELEADIIGLQEVESVFRDQEGRNLIDYLVESTGFHGVPGLTMARGSGQYGNLLLSRYPVKTVRRVDLSVPGREPRGAIDADIDCDGQPIRAVTTHFGLVAGERLTQADRVLESVKLDPTGVAVVVGDFNVWMPRSRVLRRLGAGFGSVRGVRTFPSRWPILALDRIWVRPRQALLEVRAHRTRLARVASDHLPLRARLDLSKAAESAAA